MSWKYVKLDSIGDIITGSTPSKKESSYYGDYMPFVSPAELGELNSGIKYVNASKTYLSTEGARVSKIIPKNSILTCCIGSIGKIGIAERDLVTNQQINSIIVDPSIVDFKYAYYAIAKLKNKMEQIAPSTTVKIINKSKFSELEIALPPIEIQSKIATSLDAADELIQKRKEVIAKLDELIESSFLEMFGDIKKNPLNWNMGQLGDFITDTKNGITRRGNPDTNGNIVLKLKDIRTNYIEFSDPNRFVLEETEKQKFQVEHGDLLFIRVNGNPDYVGRCAIFEESSIDEIIYYNDHIMRVRLNQEILNPIFLSRYLNSVFGKDQLKDKVKTSAGQFTINQQGLSAIMVPLIPINLQNNFVRKVSSIEKMKNEMNKQLIKLEENFQSLLHQAFTGRLQFRDSKVDGHAFKC